MSAAVSFPHSHKPRLSADQLRRRYVIALSLIAFLTIASQFLLQMLISNQAYDSRVVNIAGRQRMLSQKITKTAYYLVSAPSPEVAVRYRRELADALGQWQRSHDGLLNGDVGMGLPGKNSDKVIALYDAIQPHYEAIVAAATSILAAGGDGALLDGIGELKEHEAQFLTGMDSIVFQYDREANAKVEFTSHIETGLMIFTLLVLVLEATFIFAPATRRIQRDMQELADREQDLGLLFSASPTPLLLIDGASLTIQHANQEAAKLLATPVDALVQAPLARFLPRDAEANRPVFAQLADDSIVNEQEILLHDARQTPIDALLSVRAIRFSGQPVLVLGITDITEFRRAQRTLAEETRSVEEKNRELSLLYEITSYLAEPASRETVCRGMLLKLSERLNVSGGAVRLLNAATQELEIVVSDNLPESFLKAEARLPVKSCLCGHAAASGTASVADGLAESPGNVTLLNNCRKCGFAAVAAIPIRSKNQVLGVMTLFFERARILNAHELRLLEAVGLHLGVVIENLSLVVREKEMAVSEERNLLAQELHDSIAQALAFLNIQAQMLQESLRQGQLDNASAELALIREGIQESYDNVRELLVHFRIRVDHAELDDAIRSALEKFEGQTGLRTSFVKAGDGVVPAAVSAIQVLHILQEALSNVRKHAAASAVEVTLRGGPDFSIAVRDDGRGFDPARLTEDGGAHVGIGIMRERAHRIGGRLELEAAPGRGTCVTLVLPQGEAERTHGIDDTRAVGG